MPSNLQYYDKVQEFAERGVTHRLLSRSWMCRRMGCKLPVAGGSRCDGCPVWKVVDTISEEVCRLGLEYMEECVSELKKNLVVGP